MPAKRIDKYTALIMQPHVRVAEDRDGIRVNLERALNMIDFIPISATSGNIRALCAVCEATMHRRAPRASLGAIMPGCDVQIAEGPARLIGSPSPSLICDSARKAMTR